ncbi:MAG: hypothetical protein MUF34_36310 [Polyangiaceae bacterium]|nr:hypothetical protein [Polyangiaceae bacterium]
MATAASSRPKRASERGLDRALELAVAGDVAGEREGVRAERGGERLEPVEAPGEQGDAEAAAGVRPKPPLPAAFRVAPRQGALPAAPRLR